MLSLIRITCICLTLVLSACESGNYDARPLAVARPPAPPVSPPPPPAQPLVGGTWYGTLVNDVRGTSEEVTVLVSEDGHFRFLWLDHTNWEQYWKHSGALMAGDIVFSGDSFTGAGRAYSEPGIVWSDASSASDLMISGSIDRSNKVGGRIDGIWSTASGDSGSFVFGRTIFGGAGSQLNHLPGTWGAIDYARPDNPSAIITISANGSYLGQDSQGCIHTGQFSTVDTRSNHYNVQNVVSDCDIDNTYTGLAFRDGWYDELYLSVDDGTRPLLLLLHK